MRKASEMPYHIGLKVKIYPSCHQKRIIAVNDGARRAVYNHMVAVGNERYRLSQTADFVPSDRKRLSYLSSVTDTARNIKNAMPFLYGKEVDDQAVANAIMNYKTAWKNMKALHRGIPAFKKKSYEQSYQTNAHYYKDGKSNVRFSDPHHVFLPKLGRIRIGASTVRIRSLMERTADTRIGTITITRDACGEYWASFSISSEEPFRSLLKKTGSMHGIDLNLIDLVNDSDGGSCDNRRFLKKSMKKLTKAQKKLSRMAESAKKEKRGLSSSKNYQEQRRHLAVIHRKVARQREEYLHILSKQEVENQDFIAAEDLKVSNLLKNHKLARSISDAGWRTLLIFLSYKAALYGKTFVLVPPQNTTQACSSCGYVLKGEEKLTLAIREWNCPSCGAHHMRDTNAAQNILKKGLQRHNSGCI